MKQNAILTKGRLIVLLMTALFWTSLSAQNIIKGTVRDYNGEPIVGASIIVKNTTQGTASDINGQFSLSFSGNYPVTIVSSFIGYTNVETIVRNAQPVLITMNEDVETLDEVVVTAGGLIRQRREQGYNTMKVTSKELVGAKAPSAAGGLVGKVPGLQVSATTSGVNPTYRLLLRGNRSINGNNEALIVVDNSVVNGDFLSNLNPNDIENIQVLNGAAGAALYGSEASNGVLLVTTKQGQKGKPVVRLSHTTTWEQVSLFPKLQDRFGQGSTAFDAVWDPVENQQFGPAFDGSIRQLGDPLQDGSTLEIPYAASNKGRNAFWETGVSSQEDLSISMGNDNSTTFISAQYLDVKGTMPGDKMNRVTFRVNNTLKLWNAIDISSNIAFTQNDYDITNQTSTIYDDLTQISANVPVTDFKDWRNNPFATPDGWYNPWYENPYYWAANNRHEYRQTFLNGKVEAKWQITPWLHALYRVSVANRYVNSHQWGAGLPLSDYAINTIGKTYAAPYVYEFQTQRYRTTHEAQIGAKKKFGDLDINATAGWTYISNNYKAVGLGAAGLVIPGIYNVSNRQNNLAETISDATYPASTNDLVRSRTLGLWFDVIFGYKNYLFLHVDGRYDQVSVLDPKNRAFFYPGADMSFVVTDAISALKDHAVLDYLKLRAGWSQVGNVNISAYDINPVFSSVTGFSNGTYYLEGSEMVAPGLKPEITTGWEVGMDFRLLNHLLDANLTYYQTSTVDQTISASIPRATGYNTLLLNAGEITNRGIEVSGHIHPVRTADWEVSLGGNYTYNKNRLEELYGDLTSISVNGSSLIFAFVGDELNQIYGNDYKRVPEYADADKTIKNDPAMVGKIIVDPLTGYPSVSSTSEKLGNTSPHYRIGLDLSLRYKNWSLSSVWEHRGGYYAITTSLATGLDFSGASARSAYYNRERFVMPNSAVQTGTDSNGYPIYKANDNITVADGLYTFWTSSTYNRGVESNYVYSANYWKWRELIISYQVPLAWLKKVTKGYVKELTLSAQGRNLLLFVPKSNEYTDPDYSANTSNNATGVNHLSSTPPTRYYGASISLTF